MSGRIRAFWGAVFSFLCILAAWTNPALAQESNPFTIQPAEGSSTSERGDYFLIKANPGDRVVQSIVIRNDSDSPITIELSAVDARTGPVGGVSYNLPEDPRVHVGSWVELQTSRLSLPAQGTRRVSFTVSIPPDVGAGEHLGGISAAIPRNQPTPSETGTGASIVVKSRRIVAVQVDLPGGVGPHLVIEGVDPAARADGLYMEIRITHDGHKLTRGNGFIELQSESFRTDFGLDTFVPGTSIRYPIKWTNESKVGRFTGHVEISYDGLVAVWDGSFEVGTEVTQELEDRQVTEAADEGQTADAGMRPLAIGLAAGFGMGLLVALVILVVIVIRRRKKREVESESLISEPVSEDVPVKKSREKSKAGRIG